MQNRRAAAHLGALLVLAAAALVWTWPLELHFGDAIPGTPGDNYSFVWNLWWARHALADPTLSFFHSTYLFSPFGVDLINHPHTVLQGMLSATVLHRLSVVEAENVYIVVSIFLNGAAAYALAYDLSRRPIESLLAGLTFGCSPYIAAQLLGHFDLLSAWTLPLFALSFRRALQGSWKAAIASGVSVALAAYTAYYYVVYQAVFALAYSVGSVAQLTPSSQTTEPRDAPFLQERVGNSAAFSVRLLAVGAVALDLFLMLWIWMTGGTSVAIGRAQISLRGYQNPLLALWLLALVWMLARWRVNVRLPTVRAADVWQAVQALTITAATFAVLALPLIIQAFRLAVAGRYVTQTYFWRSAPRGIDVATLVAGNPFHWLLGAAVSRLY